MAESSLICSINLSKRSWRCSTVNRWRQIYGSCISSSNSYSNPHPRALDEPSHRKCGALEIGTGSRPNCTGNKDSAGTRTIASVRQSISSFNCLVDSLEALRTQPAAKRSQVDRQNRPLEKARYSGQERVRYQTFLPGRKAVAASLVEFEDTLSSAFVVPLTTSPTMAPTRKTPIYRGRKVAAMSLTTM